jgi:uncharacterized protein (TIGR02246 family)
MTTLEERLQRLEATEAIRYLLHCYAFAAHHHHDPDGMAACFAEDGVWEGEGIGRHEGRPAIRAFFRDLAASMPFVLHYFTNHRIDLAPSGTEAQGACYSWIPCTMAGQALWQASQYTHHYRKVHGQWLFARYSLTLQFITPYDAGWVRERFVPF